MASIYGDGVFVWTLAGISAMDENHAIVCITYPWLAVDLNTRADD